MSDCSTTLIGNKFLPEYLLKHATKVVKWTMKMAVFYKNQRCTTISLLPISWGTLKKASYKTSPIHVIS